MTAWAGRILSLKNGIGACPWPLGALFLFDGALKRLSHPLKSLTGAASFRQAAAADGGIAPAVIYLENVHRFIAYFHMPLLVKPFSLIQKIDPAPRFFPAGRPEDQLRHGRILNGQSG